MSFVHVHNHTEYSLLDGANRIPEMVASQDFPMRPGDLLVITSDGIDENHLDGIDFAAPALTIAEQILHSHAKDNDDALVLTARHRGASG